MNRDKTVSAIRMRLRAVGCPFANDSSLLCKIGVRSLSVAKQTIVNTVSWLEDQCIRLYDISDREALRKNDRDWNKAFEKYLYELNCPCLGAQYNEDNKLQCLLWIASHAVNVEYEDNRDSIVMASCVDEIYNAPPKEVVLSDEDLKLLESFRNSLLSIAKLMNISVVDENNISVLLDMIEKELKSLISQIQDGKLLPPKWSLDDLPITMGTNDAKLKDAMCVMECLYNEDVREIQDKVNYIIEQVQIITARPDTDASLGVVGF
ncbi:hypothetical protein BLSTO_02910 [Blastocystis sp. subtype 1]